MHKAYFLFVVILFFLTSCKQEVIKSPDNTNNFNIEDVKTLIIENGKKWGEALRKKDASIISDLYDGNAHYLPNKENTIYGNKAITEYWKASMPFLTDLALNMESLEGTKELLYETGNGIVLVQNQKMTLDTLKYKYVNVWKLNKDGKYRVVIDVFNELKNE